MNTIERLLKFDKGQLKLPEKTVKVKLGKLGNQEFEFHCKALTSTAMNEAQEAQFEYKIGKKGGKMEAEMLKPKLIRLRNGIDEFKNKDLRDHFGARTPDELIQKLLLPGEIDDLVDVIDELSGFETEDEEDKSTEETIENL